MTLFRPIHAPLAVAVALLASCGDDAQDAPPTDDAGADAGSGAGASSDADSGADAGPVPCEGSGDPGDDLNGVAYEPPECATYAQAGPWPVGVTTIDLDEGDRTVQIEVFYPAEPGSEACATPWAYDMRVWLPEDDQEKIPDESAPLYALRAFRDLPAASSDVGFPVVLFSHGFAGYRLQSAALLNHIASWGYVVASADHPERGLAQIVGSLIPGADRSAETVLGMIARLEAEAGDPGSRLAGVMDLDRIAMTGHSAGGGTTFNVAPDPRIDTFISYAAGAFSDIESPLTIPGLLLAGEIDGIVQTTSIRPTYDQLGGTRRYISIANAGHLIFSDLCVIGREQGGILALAAEFGIEVNPLLLDLGSDGCREGDMRAEQGWPVVHQITVAWLKSYLDADASGVGLGEDLTACLGDDFAEDIGDDGPTEASGEGSGG